MEIKQAQDYSSGGWTKEKSSGLVNWLKTDEAKKASDRSFEESKVAQGVIEKMTDVDPDELKKPYTI